MLQQHVLHGGCSWQDTRDAIEAIKEVAERRHQEALLGITSQAEEHHRSAVAQFMGEAVRALEEQAQGHARATEQLKREAIVFHTEAATYVEQPTSGRSIS